MDARTPTVGSLIDKLDDLREKKRKADLVVKELEAQYSELDTVLMQRLQAEGMQKASGKKATYSLGEEVVATVVDWDIAWKTIAKQPQLMQRRISNPAFRELLEHSKIKFGNVDLTEAEEKKATAFYAKLGMTPFVKIKSNLRSIK